MGDWLAGYADPDDDDQDQAPLSELTKAAIPSVFTCKHCRTDRLTMKSTNEETVKFVCVHCGRYSTYPAPLGVAKIYRPLADADFESHTQTAEPHGP
jgi:transcription elongation factor Elf1